MRRTLHSPFAKATAAVAVLAALLAAELRGDAIVVTRAMQASTIAEIFVDDGSIRVELEIGVADLPAFRNVLPDKLYARLAERERPLAERLVDFFASDWVVTADGGPPLVGEVKQLLPRRRLRRDEITGEPLPAGDDEGELVVFVELLYPLPGRPATLALTPPGGGETGSAAANIGFVVYHGGLPVNEFRYLGRTATLDLDWDDPWYSRFRNRNLKRQFDAPLSVFLYVEPLEVRKEIVVRPRDLQQWVDLGLEGEATIPVDRQEELKQRVAQFLAARGEVRIDGRVVPATLDRIHFIRRTLRWTGVVDPPEDLDAISATLGVIFVYPIESLPQEATLTWDLFGGKIQRVPASATDEAGGFPTVLTPDDPLLRWQNFLTNPTIPAMRAVPTPPRRPEIRLPLITVLSAVTLLTLAAVGWRSSRRGSSLPRGLVAAGGAVLVAGLLGWPYARASLANPFAAERSLPEETADQVVVSLLHNTYRAFDRREEQLVYDRLAASVAGDLLADVYLQTRQGMELEGQGGARVKVDQVELLEAASAGETARGGFVRRCRWNAAGSVGHWGHTHRRTNQYEALVTVEPVDAVWKITALEVLDQQRLDEPLGKGPLGKGPPAGPSALSEPSRELAR